MANTEMDLDRKLSMLKADEKSAKELHFAASVAGMCKDTELNEALMSLYCKKVDAAREARLLRK